MTDGTTATAKQREKLLALEAERRQQQVLLRQRIVRDYANDVEVSFEDLTESGLTVEYLDEQKRAIDRRRDLRAQMDRVAESESTMHNLTKTIADRIKQRDAEFERQNVEIRAIEAERDAARKAYSDGRAARAELVRTCNNPEAQAKIAEVDRKLEIHRINHESNSSLLKSTQHALDDNRNKLAIQPDAEISARVIRLTTEVETLNANRIELDQRFEDLKRERKQVEDTWCCDPNRI
ncbi:hypothetical protein [Schlesneria sp. DSM 10557]|uniref:hypothetical protein n=1 Tax=Schlesneria sp. DSM 10557 TaxID=3044399 RepID=UPI0035A04F96